MVTHPARVHLQFCLQTFSNICATFQKGEQRCIFYASNKRTSKLHWNSNWNTHVATLHVCHRGQSSSTFAASQKEKLSERPWEIPFLPTVQTTNFHTWLHPDPTSAGAALGTPLEGPLGPFLSQTLVGWVGSLLSRIAPPFCFAKIWLQIGVLWIVWSK